MPRAGGPRGKREKNRKKTAACCTLLTCHVQLAPQPTPTLFNQKGETLYCRVFSHLGTQVTYGVRGTGQVVTPLLGPTLQKIEDASNVYKTRNVSTSCPSSRVARFSTLVHRPYLSTRRPRPRSAPDRSLTLQPTPSLCPSEPSPHYARVTDGSVPDSQATKRLEGLFDVCSAVLIAYCAAA